MIRRVFSFNTGILIFTTLLPVSCVAAGQKQAATTRPDSVALVELFTSEGCSSCPPAEALLTELTTDAQHSGKPVITLAFHVDYWNDLGWRDPFSEAAYTRRQQRYSQTFGLDSIYTPQMIVNGTTQFIGSDRAAAASAIGKALATPAPAAIALTSSPVDGGFSRVNYEVSGADAGTMINIALVQRSASSNVLRGENGGRLLHETNVVRWFQSETLAAGKKGTVTIPALPGLAADQLAVVVFAQRPNDSALLGASILPRQ